MKFKQLECGKRNKELENFIMEHSDEVEIIEPKSLRNKILKNQICTQDI